MNPPKFDLTGLKFNRLTALRHVGSRGNSSLWLCQCDCGNTHEVTSAHLRTNQVKSCGCQKIESATKHGFFSGGHGKKDATLSPELRKVYRAWRSIKTRCFDINARPYKDYGARGITMCEQWRNDFVLFLKDVGYAPSDQHSIGRVDNDGDYEPTNCRWETRRQQQANRRCTVFVQIGDERLCLAEWARRAGITPEALAQRVRSGRTGLDLLAPKHQRVA